MAALSYFSDFDFVSGAGLVVLLNFPFFNTPNLRSFYLAAALALFFSSSEVNFSLNSSWVNDDVELKSQKKRLK